jgi:exosortase/archaeosortase family protein
MKHFLSNNQIKPLINIAIFAILILGFHFFFRWWVHGDNKYWPIEGLIAPAYDFLSNLLYNNSIWVLRHLTNYDFTVSDELRTIYLGKGYVGVNSGCSGLKQFLQWLVLMSFFPGPWKHKAWFIPMGLLIIHIINVMRITMLSAYLYYEPSQTSWTFAHDYLLRPFFYVIMFLLWVVWVEKFVGKKT